MTTLILHLQRKELVMNNSKEVMLQEGRMQDLQDKAKFFKSPLLEDVEVEEEELVDPESIEMEQGAVFKKAVLEKLGFNLGIYPDKSVMINFIAAEFRIGKRGKAYFGKGQAILRDTLNVGGRFVGNDMDIYLNENNVSLDEYGQIVCKEDGSIDGYFQSSHLKAANITPRHLFFKIAEDLLPKKKRQKHFDLGEALHACLMEPTRFSRYVVAPNDPTNTHEGVMAHLNFWKEKLHEKMVAEEGNAKYGTENFNAYIESLRMTLNVPTWNQVLDFIHIVKMMLLSEKEVIKDGHRFNNLITVLEKEYKAVFGDLAIKFAEKVTDDPYQSILKELGLKKNESLGDASKTKPFDPSPKLNLIDGLMQQCTDFITANEANENTEYFTSLDQKKNYMDTLSLRCELESVSENDYLIIKALESNAKSYGNGIIYKLATHAHRECSAYLDDYDGLPLKVRPDMIQFEENIGVNAVISVKSTSSPNIEKFFYDTAKYQYELSEGMYQEVLSKVTGREFRSTITIMYQTVEPYGVAVFWWKPEDIELGRHKFLQAHHTLKETIGNGVWPGYDIYAEEGDFGIIDFQLPWWSAKGLEERNQEGLGAFHPTGDIE